MDSEVKFIYRYLFYVIVNLVSLRGTEFTPCHTYMHAYMHTAFNLHAMISQRWVVYKMNKTKQIKLFKS